MLGWLIVMSAWGADTGLTGGMDTGDPEPYEERLRSIPTSVPVGAQPHHPVEWSPDAAVLPLRRDTSTGEWTPLALPSRLEPPSKSATKSPTRASALRNAESLHPDADSFAFLRPRPIAPGYTMWSGRVPDGPWVVAVSGPKKTLMRVESGNTPGRLYTGEAGSLSDVRRVNSDPTELSCGAGTLQAKHGPVVPATSRGVVGTQTAPKGPAALGASSSRSAVADDDSIDILFMYEDSTCAIHEVLQRDCDASKEIDIRHGLTIEQFVAYEIALMQDALSRSGTPARLRLAGIDSIEEWIPGGLTPALGEILDTSSTLHDEVTQARDDYGADVVAIITANAQGYGGQYPGLANFARDPSVSDDSERAYFFLVRARSDNLLLYPHELGHLLGLGHDRGRITQGMRPV